MSGRSEERSGVEDWRAGAEENSSARHKVLSRLVLGLAIVVGVAAAVTAWLLART
jgi:hypothetical protein